MTPSIATVARSLAAERDVDEAYATVDRWAAEGRVAELLELWNELEHGGSEPENDEARARLEEATDHVEEQLALSAGDDRVEAVFDLARRERTRSCATPRSDAARARGFASRLAHGQPLGVFENALAKLERRDLELAACWMHEIVLRGRPLTSSPRATELHASLAATAHPLGRLPLELLPAEAEAPTYVPLYGEDAIQSAVARLERGPTSTRTIPPPDAGTRVHPKRIVDPKVEARLLSAVVPWSSGADSRTEAKVFALDPPVAARAAGRQLLRGLGLECLAKAEGLRVAQVEVEVVWGALFAAASNGGAREAGLAGAYGRCAAWTSLGALVGEPEGALATAVDAAAVTGSFLIFSAGAPWFHDVAWDLGIAAIRGGGATVAVLAATDA